MLSWVNVDSCKSGTEEFRLLQYTIIILYYSLTMTKGVCVLAIIMSVHTIRDKKGRDGLDLPAPLIIDIRHNSHQKLKHYYCLEINSANHIRRLMSSD
jgi:hypothetical protein